MAQTAMGYSALDVAKWFINATDRESGDAITHLKVQKLLYYAQGWSLAHYDRALFGEDLQAWAHGPVSVRVWNAYRNYGWDALPKQKLTEKFNSRAEKLLHAVNRKYGIYSAKQLERLTHSEPPWLKARGNLPPEAASNAVIERSDMKKYFKSLLH